jgi:hypothetical protein
MGRCVESAGEWSQREDPIRVVLCSTLEVARGERKEASRDQHKLRTGTSTVKRIAYSRSCLAYIEVVDESDGSARNAVGDEAPAIR